MSFTSEFEFENELELEFPPPLKSQQLIEYKSAPGGFMARVSGFDEGSLTSADPAVVRLQSAAIDRIAQEVTARTRAGWCVEVVVTGHADPRNDPKPQGPISAERARVIANRIRARTSRIAGVRGITPSGVGARDPLWPSATHIQRALNRRIEVTILQILCA